MNQLAINFVNTDSDDQSTAFIISVVVMPALAAAEVAPRTKWALENAGINARSLPSGF